jgi:hypothetical protein
MFLALAAAAALQAGGLLGDPALAAALGRAELRPGAWAEYLVRRGNESEARVRVTALGAEGEGSCWVELAAASASGLAGAVRLLLRGGALSGPGIERMQVLLAGQQAVEIPLERLGPGRAGPPPPEARRVGSARVTVAAGAFAAEVLQVQGMRVWRSAGVPLWGLVKARSGRRSIELLASGSSGGRSVFPAGEDQGKGSESAK